MEAFRQPHDVHTCIAAALHDQPSAAVTAPQREAAKRVTYGILYGMAPSTLANLASLTTAQAAALVHTFQKRFPTAHRFCLSVVQSCRAHQAVRTILNRIRRLPDINSSDKSARGYAERQAVNTVVQGSAADVMKLAMLRVHEWSHGLQADTFRLVAQVHDELLLLIRDDWVNAYVPCLQREMTGAMDLCVPLAVKVSVGERWGSLQTYRAPDPVVPTAG
eukprot:GGOE01058229.1.p1 GENE.GGOE01058229.1~~GGOE01058229.1.p1  ORF type:complete len:244 (+),score=52.87 GGOE01058229.1:75-734(+)